MGIIVVFMMEVYQNYFSGGGFDGPNCKKILSNIDEVIGDEITRPVLDTFKSFRALVGQCFEHDLKPGYKTIIHQFQHDVERLKKHLSQYGKELKISWKLHIVLEHLEPFCDNNKCGLARYAEQAIESAHSKFAPTWKRYKVDKIHGGHGDALKRATVSFTSLRR